MKNVLLTVLMIVLIIFVSLDMIHNEKQVEQKNILQLNDSILTLGKEYCEWNRTNLMKELFVYYVDSLKSIGYGPDWANEKASVELGLKAVTLEYVAIEED